MAKITFTILKWISNSPIKPKIQIQLIAIGQNANIAVSILPKETHKKIKTSNPHAQPIYPKLSDKLVEILLFNDLISKQYWLGNLPLNMFSTLSVLLYGKDITFITLKRLFMLSALKLDINMGIRQETFTD